MTEPQTTPIAGKKLTLHLERGGTGMWFVTCDEHRGLLLAEHTIAESLAGVVPALRDLLAAGPSHPDPTAFDGIEEVQP